MLVTVAVPIFHYFGLLNIIVVYLTMVAHSFTSVFFLSARFAVLPTIVGDSRLDEANSLLYISFPIIGALSIISGGTVAEFVGIAPPFLVSSITFLVATIYLTNCNIPSSNKKSQGLPKLSKIATELKADLTEGAEEILRVKIVKRLIFYSFLINIFNVAFPQSIAAIGWGFFGSALLYGTLRVSFQGGQVLGSYLVQRIEFKRSNIFSLGVGIVGMAALLLGIFGFIIQGFFRSWTLVTLAIMSSLQMALGVGQGIYDVPQDSIIQAEVSDQVRGKVLSFENILLGLPTPLLSVGVGILLAKISPFHMFGFAGISLVTLSIIIQRTLDEETQQK